MDETLEPEHASTRESTRPHEARHAVALSARRCMEQATRQSIAVDAVTLDRYASDDVFRRLHKCVDEFARVMRAFGASQLEAEAMLTSALGEAAEPGEPHPALSATVKEWFHDAFKNTGAQDN